MTDTPAVTSPLQLTINPVSQGKFWSREAPNFKDFLDTVNPLEHIPIVSTIYQAITGDTPSTGAKLAGSALFGGPVGLVASLFDTIIQNATGSDIAGNVMAVIEGKPVPMLQQQDTTQVASNGPRDGLSANQRAAYNAYVNASMLT
ncbi:MAG: hypothetical protein KGJ06_05460 [Pseudomonadota bacterium]|nr:hypothetical protein [Pseudomonadota bacterium]